MKKKMLIVSLILGGVLMCTSCETNKTASSEILIGAKSIYGETNELQDITDGFVSGINTVGNGLNNINLDELIQR